MNRKPLKKSIERRRRRNRFRKLKAAALALGLATAWGASETQATSFTISASTTITLSSGSTFFISNSTVTLDPPRGASGPSVIPASPPDFFGSVRIGGPDADSFDAGDFIFSAVAENADGTSDIVLSFPNGGDGVVGQPWTSLFVDNQPVPVREPLLIPELEADPFRDTSVIPPNSELQGLFRFQDLLNTPLGETATLIAFTGATNTGEIVGTITFAAVPEPATAGLLAAAFACATVGVRRRD